MTDISQLIKASTALIERLDSVGIDDSVVIIARELADVKNALQTPSLAERLEAKGFEPTPEDQLLFL